jgi:hypothetical protein
MLVVSLKIPFFIVATATWIWVENMAKAYPSCIGGYKSCIVTEECVYSSYCKQLSQTSLKESAKVLRVLGNRIFNMPIVTVRGLNATDDDNPYAEIYINGKRFVAHNIREVDDVLRWFKP